MLIQMYSDVVLEIDNSLFEDALEEIKLKWIRGYRAYTSKFKRPDRNI